jgi:HAD superfamily hydrolase (TIGR01490 family)
MTSGSKSKFAVFDIDGTFFRWQLFHELVFELIERGLFTPSSKGRVLTARARWRNRETPHSYRDYELALVEVFADNLKGLDVESFSQAAKDIVNRSGNELYTYTRDLARSLKDQGYMLLAISGSFSEIVAPFAQLHGFDDWRATVCEQKDGMFTGAARWMTHDGIHRKAQSLYEMIDQHGLTTVGSLGIGDTTSDIPMLEVVEHPIVFNPNAALFKHAQEKKWDVVLERKDVIYKLRAEDSSYLLLAEDGS